MNTYFPPSRNPFHDVERPSRFASSEGFPDVIVPLPGPQRDPASALKARAIAGGLQEHSVGGLYPLYVMAIGTGSEHHYEVHNLQDGTVAAYQVDSTRRMWVGSEAGYDDAHIYAETSLANQGNLLNTLWIKA